MKYPLIIFLSFLEGWCRKSELWVVVVSLFGSVSEIWVNRVSKVRRLDKTTIFLEIGNKFSKNGFSSINLWIFFLTKKISLLVFCIRLYPIHSLHRIIMNFVFVSNIFFFSSKDPKNLFFHIFFYVYESDYKIDENFEFYSRKETKKEIIVERNFHSSRSILPFFCFILAH